MKFEWDEAKNRSNSLKHGIGFDLALTLFVDPYRLEGAGRIVRGEQRHYLIGRAVSGQVLFMVFVWRTNRETKKSAASSRPSPEALLTPVVASEIPWGQEQLITRSEADIRAYIKSPKAKRDAALLEERIRKHGIEPTATDLKAIPLLTDDELAGMYRPVKTPITVRLDGDIVAWLKSKGGRYQEHLNAALRATMMAERKH